MMFKLLSAISLLSLLAVIGALEVEVTLDPEDIGPERENVKVECKYDIADDQVDAVDLIFKLGGGETLEGIITYKAVNEDSENQPKGNYADRVTEFSGPTGGVYSVTIANVTWCTDVGAYDCYVAPVIDESNVRGASAEAILEARKHEGKMMLNGNPFEEDTRVDESSGSVSCTGYWVNNQVSAALDDGGDPVNETGVATGEDECTNKAEATLDYTFNGSQGSLTFTCIVTIEGEEQDEVSYSVYFGQDPPTTQPPVDSGSSVPFLSACVMLVALLFTFA